ncbi:MAG: MBL fold metallo-hydrolase [Candidatus Methanoperedens sp.]|nr:MBL fold metallo-hydrolase [Candidatus Methanoperedens sp.]MCZ7369583.1 MBL fold metallo-hydrolase [Candidatus Methanoperedens sp.]
MFLERIISDGLTHYSYIAGDNGEAFIIDPRRDIDPYIKIAEANCCQIKFVFETHRNEDYLIGSLELEKETGCRIIHSDRLDFGYGEPVTGGDTFDIGGMNLNIIETPGHSPESLSFVLYLSQNEPWAVFTGDALFYGNVGRTDLLGREKTSECASLLFDSLHGKFLTLGDGVIIYPAHGSGSACGGSMSDVPVSTIGCERTSNPLLRMGRDEFIGVKKNEIIPLPPYFALMAEQNLYGPKLLELRKIKPVDVSMFVEAMPECSVIDTRSPLAFAGGHVRGSYNIWLYGLATFPGWILDYDKDVLLVTERPEDVELARLYLARIGFDRLRGHLCEGIWGWYSRGMPLERSGVLTASGLRENEEDMLVLDVRDSEEYAEGHIPGALNIYVGELEKKIAEIPPGRPVVAVCGSGNRAGLGASILKRQGIEKVYNLIGGMTAWKEKGYPTER